MNDETFGSPEDTSRELEWYENRPDGHGRCCNCGLPIPEGSHLHVRVTQAWRFGVCGEGCAIQVWVRGKCATNSSHPWVVGYNAAGGAAIYAADDSTWLHEWPEVAEIRARIAAGSR